MNLNILQTNKILNRFLRDVNDVFDYHFTIVSDVDYTLEFMFTAKSKVLTSIFNRVKRTIENKKKFDKLKDANIKHIEQFEVPEQLNNRVRIAILKQIKDVCKEAEKDGITVIRNKVEKAVFINDKQNTKIKIKVVGQYVRK